MMGDYPLGSHSSYVGFFYKTGLLGLGCILFALFKLIKAVFLKHFKKNMLFLLGVGAILLAMALEDIDGADWLLVLFMTINGIYLCEHDLSQTQKSSCNHSQPEKVFWMICFQ